MIRAATPLLLLAACADETVSGYADPGPWRLVEIDGAAPETQAVLRFPRRGRVDVALPCGALTAQQTAPYPWFVLSHFELGDCPATPGEEAVVQALAGATLAEAQGDVLILTDETGGEIVFRQ